MQLCRDKNYPFLRLDGSTTIGKRQKLVKKFNDPNGALSAPQAGYPGHRVARDGAPWRLS
jgi:hypothetical protein